MAEDEFYICACAEGWGGRACQIELWRNETAGLEAEPEPEPELGVLGDEHYFNLVFTAVRGPRLIPAGGRLSDLLLLRLAHARGWGQVVVMAVGGVWGFCWLRIVHRSARAGRLWRPSVTQPDRSPAPANASVET